ncbi:T9SS type A sorting domain-containing protein [Fulvivirga lutea]|uniref:T9SS type A sorting domain-containing protein n=1 Tax=Fulvivirga lutea TaxID=2810512 RepID=A0A975A262_9BACT|nr:T9SS type A sorting domain-containing protein [Fulvivirga lutea]QSE98950.1 T9SS type A sorting domain-containing protein [Fulvivirga lutea]
MRALITSALLLVFGFSSHAQSFEVVGSGKVFTGKVGEKVAAEIPIRNLTNKPIQIVIRRLDKVIGTSQSTYICWGEDCLNKDDDQIPLSKRISAQEVSQKFVSTLEAGLVPGISSVKYLIYNRDNPSDAIEYEVNYTIEEAVDEKFLYESEEIQLKEIYPNPVSEFAVLNYNLKDENVNAEIVLHNVLGSIIGRYDLIPFESKLKIITEDFNPGVYFYTLYIDGDGVTTHKIVIRK